MKQFNLLFLLVVSFISINAQAMSVVEAYAAIPHQRTVFDGNASRLTKVQVESLKQLFSLAEQGVVIRVEGLRALYSADAASLRKTLNDYRMLTSSLASLKVPSEIKPVQELVLQAIENHHNFFEGKLRDSGTLARRDVSLTAEIHQASQKLHQAYFILMQNFPGEPAINKAAFYDYLCALDFI